MDISENSGFEKAKSEVGRNDCVQNDCIEKLFTEERLRLDIRKGLEGDTRGNKVFKFLNSPFFLFLLSSVVLAGMGKLYYYYDGKSKEESLVKQEVRKLSFEYEYRIKTIQQLLNRMDTVSEESKVPLSVLVWRIIIGEKLYAATIPEYNNVHLLGIIVRLNNLGVLDVGDRVKQAAMDLEFSKNDDWKYNTKVAKEYLGVLLGFLDAIKKKLN
jgi:hypothetical protein